MKFKRVKTNVLSGRRLVRVTLFIVLVLFLFMTHCKIKKSDNSSENGGSENVNNNNNGYEYPANFSFIRVPNPLSGDNPLFPLQAMSTPEIGKSFKDHHFSTKLTRVTQINGINGRHEYSRFDPFNSDKSMIVLLDDSGDYNVYKTNSMPYNNQNNFVGQTNNIEDPRWDNDNPNLLWGLSDFKIVRDNITTGSRETIKDFAADSTIKPILEPGESYEGTNRIPLVRLYYADESPHGFSAGVHISCNTPGYCVVSTHITADDQDKNWLDRVHIVIKLDPNNPRAFYLAKVYNTCREYWEETHGTITKDGTRIVWASNWNQDVGSEKIFLVQLDMPPNWKSLLDHP